MIATEVEHDGGTSSSHGSFGVSAASGGVLLLVVATALCMWWHRQRKSAPEEAADKEQLRKDLLHAHDSVVVAKKRITGEEVKAEASIPAIYASSDGGSNCGNSSGGAAGADRVPMVAFLDLPEEEQKRLRAGNINDSVLIMRNKRATSGSGAAASGAAKGGDAAVAYYQQQLAQLRSSSDGGSGEGGAEGAVRMPGELHGRSSDGSESGKRVQFGAAEVVAVCSTPGLSSAAGCASAAGVVLEAGAAPAAEAAPVPGCVPPVGAGAAADALLPGGVDGESISIDTSELAAGQRHSRGDDTARISEAPLPGSAS